MHMVKTATVQVGRETYKSTKGVPQGTKLGPMLYNLATSNMIRKIKQEVGEENVLAYMDDVIWREKDKELNMTELKEYQKSIGLEIQ
jgi:hypothetical protein